MEVRSLKERVYGGIDCFRFMAAILVIAIHTSPLISLNVTANFVFTSIIGRVAVPFFLMSTGFLLFRPNNEKVFSYKKFLLKSIKLYSISILLYLPLNFYAGHFTGEKFLVAVLKDVFVNGTFYHLWYFPATILGVGIIFLLLKYVKHSTAVLLVISLYVIGILGDSYYGITSGIPLLKRIYDSYFVVFDYTRNGLFFAPIYILLGVKLSRGKQYNSIKKYAIGLLFSLTLLVMEGLLLNGFSVPKHDSMYLMLLPSMYFLFQILLSWKIRSYHNLRNITMWIYILHPWCIVLVRGIAKLTTMEAMLVNNSIIHFLTVTVLSVLGAWMCSFTNSKGRKKPFQKERAWVEIDLSNLKHNFLQLKSILPKGSEIMGVVKADAYGHGAPQIASELQRVGVKSFAVASLKEAITLRESGIKGDILVLGYTYSEEIHKLVRYNLVQTVVDYNYATFLNGYGKKIRVHIKIDTGMNRLGESFRNIEEIENMFRFPNLMIDGMYTHLCVADSHKKKDVDFTKGQIEGFYSVANQLKALGHCVPKLHIQSTYGLLNYPEVSCSYARIGIALYGLLSNFEDETKAKIQLKPVLSVKARVSTVKELEPSQTIGYGRNFVVGTQMKTACITIGYADGIPRNLANGYVLVKGAKVPIIGRICMDQLTIDVTDVVEIEQGDIITIIGQEGNEMISAEEVAGQASTITNEIVSRLGSRLERIYIPLPKKPLVHRF